MPQKVRIISGPRNKAFDSYIEDILDRGALGVEHTYFGIEEEERANFVRRKMKTAGTHMDPPCAIKSYYYACTGCPSGGPACRFHVSFTAYDMEIARAYKQRLSGLAARSE